MIEPAANLKGRTGRQGRQGFRGSRTLLWCALLVTAWCLLIFGPTPAVAQQSGAATTTKPASESTSQPAGQETVDQVDQIQFEQERARAHMLELEQRMFHLAEMIRDGRPEDSARLLMGLRRSREELILDRMAVSDRLLEQADYATATEEQQQIIVRLEALRQLLLSADLNLELKLQQLRQLREAIEDLDALIEREQRQQAESRRLAEQAEADPSRFDPLAGQERRHHRQAADLQRRVSKISNEAATAAGQIGQGAQAMDAAAGQLDREAAGQAAEQQGEAIGRLEQARAELARQQRALQEQLVELVRRQVMDNLARMLLDQQQVRQATERLIERAGQGQPQAVLALRRLAESELAIADLAAETMELAKDSGFSAALPPTLGVVRDRMLAVGADLQAVRTETGLVDEQEQIEADLEALLDAMKMSAEGGEQGQAGQGGRQRQREINRLLAEVQMLRLMQQGIHQQTRQVERLRQADQLPEAEVDQRRRRLSNRQEQVRRATETLHERMQEEGLR